MNENMIVRKMAAAIRMFLVLLFLLALVSGCAILDCRMRGSVSPDTGTIELPGLKAEAIIKRDELGIPVVQAGNMNDLLYASGYAMASDRLAQMVTYSMLGQGRLAEMAGPPVLAMDVYVRTMGLPRAARNQYEQLTPEIRQMLESFSDGVNAYLEVHGDQLPLDFRLTGYTPEAWQPINSLYIYNVLNLGLSFNLHEEIAFLNLARQIGPEKAAWMFPVHPDEPLSFEKASVINEIWLTGLGEELSTLTVTGEQLADILMPLGVAASNNWAVSPERTAKNASIIANDTHLPLEHPPIWMLMQLKAPGYHVAGVAMPGIPLITSGYNGHIAWGVTMVMGDSQDIFIERLKPINGENHYLYDGEWLPVKTITETFDVKGSDPEERTVSFTRNGPLLNSILSTKPVNPLMPPAASEMESGFGLAVRTTLHDTEATLDAMYTLSRAEGMDAARDAIAGIRFMNLNFIYGNAEQIAWQVSGQYPVRKKGRGHLPSPGWTGEYDWQGFLPVDLHPYVRDPDSGYLYTANHRTVHPEEGPVLGSSWYAPERAERIRQMLAENDSCDFEDAIRMHTDRHDVMVEKMQRLFFDSPLSAEINGVIDGWQDTRRADRARLALAMFREFDGNMDETSAGAALNGIFFHVLTRKLFADELGPDASIAWRSLGILNRGIYGPVQDHLFERPESPFWNNCNTDRIETRAEIIAESLSDAVAHAQRKMGRNPKNWQWGTIHTYAWRTSTSKAQEHLPFFKRIGAGLIARYTDRGPYPAGGGFNTINVAAYRRGDSFDVWLIPSMRMVVDFGLEEPLFLVNSGGQSGNPASPHYDDGISLFLSGENRQMSYLPENIDKQYNKVLTLRRPKK